MVALAPVRAQLVAREHAASVVSWAYDALRPDQRRAVADANPDSFFNVVRSAADYEDGTAPADLLDGNVAALRDLLQAGRYGPARTGLYVYALSERGRDQFAVVGDLAVADHDRGVIRAHELTRAAKEAELAAHLRRLRVQSSPVGLGYPATDLVDSTVRALTNAAPDLDFATPDAVRHRVWCVAAGPSTDALVAAFAAVERVYIIDGHHRVGAARQVDAEGRFLAALVPDNQLQLSPYHRLVSGPLATTASDAIARLEAHFVVEPVDVPTAPDRGDSMALFYQRWWQLRLRAPQDGRLSAALGDTLVLADVFGVADARTDHRLDFVPGGGPLEELARLAGERQGLALALAAPSVAEVFAEADAGRSMPPKSTWFEPKLRSGIFLVRR